MKLYISAFLIIFYGSMGYGKHQVIQEATCRMIIDNLNKDKQQYIMDGSIKETSEFNYLTLEPTTSSGAQFSARILLTGDYDPVTIHPRGNTVKVVASGDLAQEDRVHLHHFDKANNTHYYLDCVNL